MPVHYVEQLLVDLLIEHGIGVRKRTIEMLEVDTEAIAAIDTDS